MSISEFCVRDVICASRTTTISKAAALMRQHHIGDVVIVDETDGKRIPVGILTDRDIVVEVIALGIDAGLLKVEDLLQRPVVTVNEDRSYGDTIRQMTVNGVRRIPVVDRNGELVGIISVDDMLRQLAVPLAALAELPARGRHLEMRTRT
ncbi:MAG: CBS domain-containing protein [Betaproteobacteria bacterium]